MAETMVHRCMGDDYRRGDGFWTGDQWLAYRATGADIDLPYGKGKKPAFSALCDEVGNVLYFDTEAEAQAALKNPALKTVREYLRGRRKGA